MLHLKNLPPEIIRERALRHLVAKGVVRSKAGTELEAQVSALAGACDAPLPVKAYARAYLRLTRELALREDNQVVPATLINASSPQALPQLTAALSKLDWSRLLEERSAQLRRVA